MMRCCPVHPKYASGAPARRFDTSKPDGTPRKVLDVSRLAATGWKASIDLDTGIRTTYEWFLQQVAGNAELRGY